VWDEEIRIKTEFQTKMESKNASRTAKPKYHEGRGKRLKRYGDGWTSEGICYFKEMCVTFKALKMHVNWTHLQKYWHQYQKTHANDYYKFDDPNELAVEIADTVTEELWAIEELNETKEHDQQEQYEDESSNFSNSNKRARLSEGQYLGQFDA